MDTILNNTAAILELLKTEEVMYDHEKELALAEQLKPHLSAYSDGLITASELVQKIVCE